MYCSATLEAGRAEDRHLVSVGASLCRCGPLQTMWCELDMIFGGPVSLCVVRGNLRVAVRQPCRMWQFVRQMTVLGRVAPKLARWRFLRFSRNESVASVCCFVYYLLFIMYYLLCIIYLLFIIMDFGIRAANLPLQAFLQAAALLFIMCYLLFIMYYYGLWHPSSESAPPRIPPGCRPVLAQVFSARRQGGGGGARVRLFWAPKTHSTV